MRRFLAGVLRLIYEQRNPLKNRRQIKCSNILNYARRPSVDGSRQQLRKRNRLQFASGCVAAFPDVLIAVVNNGWAFAAFLILVALYLWHRDGP
jgi:hypothetical protein